MATPCVVCGTSGGTKNTNTGEPRRMNGCCGTCNSRINMLKHRLGLATFAEALEADKGRTYTKPHVAERSAPVPVLFASPGFHEVWEGDE